MGTLDGLRTVARSITDQFGTTATFTARTPGRYDIQDGAQTTAAATTTVKGVRSRFKAYELDNSVRSSDLKFIFGASNLTTPPDVDDSVTIDGEVYRLVDIITTHGTDLDVLYTMQLRRDD